MSGFRMPVSYTHLDVYKRQLVLFGTGDTAIVLPFAAFHLLVIELDSIDAHILLRHRNPVSYTHLDVYKRQNQGLQGQERQGFRCFAGTGRAVQCRFFIPRKESETEEIAYLCR